jgi:hypothetical protein
MSSVAGLALFALAAALASHDALAARPLVTDDARVVDPGGYQVETFVKAQRGVKATEYWLLPAANFGGALERFEFALGGNLIRSDEEGNSNLVLLQAKTLLKPLETNGFGFAVTVGVARLKPGTPEEIVATPFGTVTVAGEASTKTHYDPYLNGIASVSVLDDAVVLHFNAGATRDTSSHRTIGSWGVGAEVALGGAFVGIAETYGVSDEKPAYQIGLRYGAIPGRLQIDGTYGWQHASPTNLNWISVGMRILW